MLGVSQADYGYLTDDLVVPDAGNIALERLIAPLAEVEIAFRLGRALGGRSVTAADVLAATAGVAPALEIIDSRIEGWRITLIDTIADNASCGLVVLGAFRPLADLELARLGATLTVAGPGRPEPQVVAGAASAVLGHPAAAVAWLV